jgi:hypothetical protein
MLSRRRSQVFSRKGSIERSSESKLGARGREVSEGSCSRVARLGGKLRALLGGGVGSWWRKEVRRCEL